ncbi:MAG: riboflavin synthase [Planctomycetota bacterium]|nr:riboflavin synthase [Planctomycetota bacterium]
MFTGLIQAVGTVRSTVAVGQERRIEVDLGGLPGPRAIGASIALSGVCCTVVEHRSGTAAFHLSRETLDRTWLGSCMAGDRLNLEAALCAGDPLGGHLVQGHVDGVGTVVEGVDAAAGGELVVRLPDSLVRYCVEKGSIALDGVSLTIARERGAEVRIAVIPHTAQVTTLGGKRIGDPLHVEVDILAKYVEKMLAGRLPEPR